MAFQTKLSQPNFSGASALIKQSDPFSVLGKTMSELDGLIDNRQANKYIAELGTDVTSTPEGIFGAMQQAPNEAAKLKLGESFKGLSNMQALQSQAQQMEQAKAMQPYLIKEKEAAIDSAKEKEAIRREEAGLRAADLGVKRETNELKKRELQQKIDAKQGDIEVKKAERKSKGISAIGGVDKTIELAQSLLDDPQLNDVIGSIEGRTPTWSEAEAATEGVLNQLKDSIFMDARDALKGGGAITDYEGNKAAGAEINLDQTQDEESFRAQLQRLIDYKKTDRQNAMNEYSDVLGEQTKTPKPGGITAETVAPEGFKKQFNRNTGEYRMIKIGG